MKEILEENPGLRIAVLYRANFLSRNFEDVLTEDGVPYTVVGSVAFFGRMEVKDLLAYLRVIFNPEDDIALLRILNTPPRGIGSSTVDLLTQTALEKRIPFYDALSELAQDSQLGGRSSKVLLRFKELMDGWMARKGDVPPSKMLERIAEETRYYAMLQKQETAMEAESRIANIEELIRAARESEQRGETIFEFLDRASLASELDQYDPSASVVLMTLHSAKGLEFDVVFLAGMEEGLFPHSQSMNSAADLEEERRLCYVGITRARRKLYLTWTPFRRNFGQDAGTQSIASRFLKEMPTDLVEGLDFGPSYIYEEDNDYRARRPAAREEDETEPEVRWRKPQPGTEAPSGPTSLAELRSYIQQQSNRTKPGEQSRGSRGGVLRSGMRVRHAQFGDGIILSRERVGNEVKLIVTFSRVGKKTLMERYAKLEAL
jgi:DNA helicase-2/ATP-dependent DNA helicase PcrA